MIKPVGPCSDSGNNLTRAFGGSDIALDQMTARTDGLDRGFGFCGSSIVGKVVEEDINIGLGKSLRDGEADTLGAACDENSHDDAPDVPPARRPVCCRAAL